MPLTDPPQVAIIGTGRVGRGWATMIVSQGWRVTLFDVAAAASEEARGEIIDRSRALLSAGLATADQVAQGVAELKVARSLLAAVRNASWIIDAGPDDLHQRQRLLEQIEQVSRLAAVVTSSSLHHHASSLCARLRRPERLMVVNPFPPVEFSPAVEIIPSPLTDPEVVDIVRLWIRRMGRGAVVLKREVPGNLGGRLAAAIFRECLDLTLDGTLSPEEIDRAFGAGLGVEWCAAGPFITSRLTASPTPLPAHLGSLLSAYQEWWPRLSDRSEISSEELHRLTRLLERAYRGQLATQLLERERRLLALLAAIQKR